MFLLYSYSFLGVPYFGPPFQSLHVAQNGPCRRSKGHVSEEVAEEVLSAWLATPDQGPLGTLGEPVMGICIYIHIYIYKYVMLHIHIYVYMYLHM